MRAALDWLEGRYPTLPLVVGGFSFGSMVGLGVGSEDARVVAMLGLGLPVERMEYDYGFLASADKPVLVVQGEEDEFGSGDAASEVLKPMGPHITLVRIPGSDHCFTDRLDELRDTVRGYFSSGPGARTLAVV